MGEQPSYASIIAGWNQKNAGNWGHPVIGNARHWSDCPAIDTTTIAGIEGLRCNQATCALACKPGYVATGRRRAKCRKNKKTGKWCWKKQQTKSKVCKDCLQVPKKRKCWLQLVSQEKRFKLSKLHLQSKPNTSTSF